MSVTRRSTTALSIMEAVVRTLQNPAIRQAVGNQISDDEYEMMKYVCLHVRANTSTPVESLIYSLPHRWQDVLFNHALLPDYGIYMLDRKLMLKAASESRIENNNVEQIVSLGAGLCVRPMMLARKVKVFEVDRGMSRISKLAAFRDYDPAKLAGDNFVSIDCDFGDNSLAIELHSNGFDKRKKTLVLIEGVFMYLQHARVEMIFLKLKELLGEGSEVIASFLPSMPTNKMMHALLALSSEPLCSSMCPADVAKFAMKFDFAVTACSAHTESEEKIEEVYYVFQKRPAKSIKLEDLPDMSSLPRLPRSALTPVENPLYEKAPASTGKI